MQRKDKMLENLYMKWLMFLDRIQQFFAKEKCLYCGETKEIITTQINNEIYIRCSFCHKTSVREKENASRHR